MSDRPACPATGERCHLDCPADEPPGLCRPPVSVPEATPAEPAEVCGRKLPKPSSAWWMNDDQWDADACRCTLSAGHDGSCACEHTALSAPVVSSPGADSHEHDEQCESEFIEGPMSMSPCGCADRAAEPITTAARADGTADPRFEAGVDALKALGVPDHLAWTYAGAAVDAVLGAVAGRVWGPPLADQLAADEARAILAELETWNLVEFGEVLDWLRARVAGYGPPASVQSTLPAAKSSGEQQ